MYVCKLQIFNSNKSKNIIRLHYFCITIKINSFIDSFTRTDAVTKLDLILFASLIISQRQ